MKNNIEQEESFSKITMTIKWSDEPATEVSYKLGYADTTLEDMLHGVVTCLIGLTWSNETILQGMRKYIEEHDESHEN